MSTDAGAQTEYERAVQAWNNRPRRRVPSPSPRKPDITTHSNYADQIERQLQEDGHRTWGFVVYRTCYDNTDEDWAEFLKRLRWQMEWTFDYYNGRDILDLFSLTVIDDREHLDGAGTAAIREHFRQWCSTAPQSEQQPQQHGETTRSSSEIRPGQSPRYRYAIQVDAASLQSVVYDAPAPPAPDATKKGWVKLIKASWEPVPSETLHDTYDPIEGVVQKDLGWMKVPYQQAMTEYYVLARDRNWWVTSYRRPPTVMGWPYDD